MPTIIVDQISKAFGDIQAVKDVSFEVNPGEIFGLLGPNGAGKTTSIRIILDIFKADTGKVSILGGPMSEEKKNHIGYLPEERGLYQDVPLERCLVYLATLRGVEETTAHQLIGEYLERFDLQDYRKKKVKELSKGMQQKAQLITTLVHDPEVIIIDEPFAALDPVNTQMVKDLLREQQAMGKTIIMCTHQMHQVEELADRIALINKGTTVLYGQLSEIRRKFASNGVVIRPVGELPATLPFVTEVVKHNSSVLLKCENGKTPQDILNMLVQNQVNLESFEIAIPSLDEIFIRVVGPEDTEQ